MVINYKQKYEENHFGIIINLDDNNKRTAYGG